MSSKLKRDPYKLVGKRLGSLHVEDFIQSGGMGAVYRARPVRANITLAIKILKPDIAYEFPEAVDLLFKEAEQTAALNHPNIIRVTYADVAEVGEDWYAYIVMEWLEGHTLEEELAKGGPMEPERVAALLEQICEAVSYAHGRGVVHRDLTPRNVMLTRNHADEEQVKVLDFGIAKAVDATQGVNSRVMGAPHFASPEQLVLNANIDSRSDIYSLGVTAYKLLSGEFPFDSWSIEMQLRGTPRPLSEVMPGVPQAVESVIRRALAKRPEERFQYAHEFARAFRNAVSVGSGSLNLLCRDADSGSPLTGASVYLNGRFAGRTDEWGTWVKTGLVPKEYSVEVECTQYERASVKARCRAGETEDVDVPMQLKPTGELLVRAEATHATVILNGAKVGTIDESGSFLLVGVAPGTANVQVIHPKFHVADVEVEIAQGEERSVEVEMRPRSIFSPARWRRSPRPPATRPPRPPRTRLRKAFKYCALTLLLAALLVGGWQSFRYFTTGRLTVRVNVVGASVTLDGVEYGTTDSIGNILIRDLKRGEHVVVVDAYGYLQGEKHFKLWARTDEVSITLRPDVELRVTLGKKFFAEGKYSAAEEKYREAIGYAPEKAEYHKFLAEALFAKGNADEAENEFNKACAPVPNAAQCYFNSGMTWMGQDQKERAERAFTSAIEKNGEDNLTTAPYFAERAAARLKLGQTDKALADAERAVELDADSARHHAVLGDVHNKKGTSGSAIQSYRAAVERAPEDDNYRLKLAEALYNRGKVLYAKSRPVPWAETRTILVEAIKLYQEALTLTEDPEKKSKYQAGLDEAETYLAEARTYP